jgi:DNA-binding NarL/FixJ family response regulator
MVKILVVEDEESIRTTIADLLELDGHEVLQADDGDIGFEIAREHLPQLIISDIMMPTMNGHELFQALKAENDTAQIPFIFLTAMATYENIRDGMNLGADDYLVKPFDYRQLSRAVNTRLNKSAIEEQYRLRRFAIDLVGVQERERRVLAQELNSEIFDTINSLNLLISSSLQSQNWMLVDNAQQIMEALSRKLQGFSQRLSPSIIEQLPIISVFSWLIDQFKHTHALNIEFEHSGQNTSSFLSNEIKINLYRILEEILKNVVMHSRTKQVRIRAWVKDDAIYVEVQDDGVGFDLEEALKASHTGLRSIMQRVTLLEGTVRIHTLPSAGTKFELTAPLEKLAAQEINHNIKLEAPHKPPVPISQRQVILAESNEILRQGLRQILIEKNYAIAAESKNMSELVEALRELHADLLILDLSLEDSSGIDLLRSIKQQLPKIKILVLSNYQQEIYVVEALQNGANGYLLKTSRTIEFLTALQKLEENEQYVCQALAKSVMEWLLYPGKKGFQRNLYHMLTDREREIFLLVLDGLTSQEIAKRLFISSRTVEKHRSNLMSKLNLKTPAQLMRFATEQGIIKP